VSPKGARPKALSAPAKALRPALSVRRTGTGRGAVTAGISGVSSGNSSKSATAKANNVSGSVDIPLSRRWITSSRQSPARVFSSKSTAELPLFCVWGRPAGARLEPPLRSVKILRGRRSDLAVFDKCDVAAIFECVERAVMAVACAPRRSAERRQDQRRWSAPCSKCAR
jgi:hypothetical protein